MNHLSTLSTILDARVKKAANEFCKRRGLKLRYLVEQALIEQMEDEMDLAAFQERRHEERIPLGKVLAGLKKI